jgi:hypothetical protein
VVDLDERVVASLKLAEDINEEENKMDTSGDDEADNSEEGMIDPHVGMAEEEITRLEESVHPVRLVLVKVSCSEYPRTDYITMINTASKIGLCNKKFIDYCLATIDVHC